MVDHFAKLGVQRRPWLDIDHLKQRFHQLSIEIHPDRSLDGGDDIKNDNQQEFVSINSAFQCLSDTKSCLLYTSPSPRDVEESRMPSSA